MSYGYICAYQLPTLSAVVSSVGDTKHILFSPGGTPPTDVCQLFLDGCQRLLVEVRIVMKVFSQVSTIPGGAVKQKLVLCCSYKRTAAQYLAIYIQISKPLLGSYITIGDMKKVAEPIRISPVITLKHKKRGDSGYISFSVLLSCYLYQYTP